jgi:hypothetical protein
MLQRNDLTFATLMRTRACALTVGSALKSSMTSDKLLVQILASGTVRPRSKKAVYKSSVLEESQLQASSSITRVPLSAAAADSLQSHYVVVVVVRLDDLRSL